MNTMPSSADSCTPGMIMKAHGVLNENPDADRNEIREAMEGNLCRCGAHPRIIDAIETAGKRYEKGVTAMKNNRHNILRKSVTPQEIDSDRRDFLKKMGLLGGGIIVYCTIGNPLKSAAQFGPPPDFNAFLRINTDERVTCFIGKVDMGQGTISSFPQIVADDLGVAYEKVDMIMGDTDKCPWDIGTGGSMAIRIVGVQLRAAAAEAKGVLKELAAEYLKCPVKDLQTKNGVVFDKKNTSRKVTYGTLTKGKIVERHIDPKPPVTPHSDF